MDFQIISIPMLIIGSAYFFAGFIDSVCGGGGLITIPALLAAGIPASLVTGTNQAIGTPGSFTSAYTYYKNKKINFKAAAITIPFCIAGSWIGSKVNMLIPERFLQILMVALIPILLVVIMAKKDIGKECLIDSLSSSHVAAASIFIGLVIGFYQGFYGPAGGTLFIIAFVFLLKLDFISASGTTRFVVSFSSITATINYAINGRVLWIVSIAAMIFYIIGTYLGAKYAIKKGSKGVRPVMFFVIALLFIKVLTDFLAA